MEVEVQAADGWKLKQSRTTFPGAPGRSVPLWLSLPPSFLSALPSICQHCLNILARRLCNVLHLHLIYQHRSLSPAAPPFQP